MYEAEEPAKRSWFAGVMYNHANHRFGFKPPISSILKDRDAAAVGETLSLIAGDSTAFAGLRFEPALIERVFEEVMTMFQIEESSTYQLILEKGKEAGRVEGLEKGRQEGLSEAQERFSQRIIEILRKRFGPVPVALTDRLQGLNLNQLDQALANALEADGLQAFIDSL